MLCWQIRVKGGMKFVCEGEIIVKSKQDKSGADRNAMECPKCKEEYPQLVRSDKAELLLKIARDIVARK